MIKLRKNKSLLVLFMTLPTIAGSPSTVLAQDDGTPPPPPKPCVDRADFREFDFWIGTWDVHLADGTVAGSNVIAREEAGCVLVEHWTGASGGTGMSVNYVDGITKEWVQVWNSAFGVQINIRGGLTDAGMALEGHDPLCQQWHDGAFSRPLDPHEGWSCATIFRTIER